MGVVVVITFVYMQKNLALANGIYYNCEMVKICHNTHSALKSTEVDIFGTFISKGLVGLSV